MTDDISKEAEATVNQIKEGWAFLLDQYEKPSKH
jgi:hypothetical protein